MYFVTTIIGNIIYLTPFGHDWPALSIIDFSWNDFSTTFGFEYWALLLFPFVLTPAIALPISTGAKPIMKAVAPWIGEIGRFPYFLISGGLFFYAFYSLHGADASTRMTTAEGAMDAVHARFSVLAALGYWPQMVMQSLLVFLVIYAVIKSLQGNGLFWYIAAGIGVPLLSVALILLNMKWPVVIFLLLVTVCVFVCSKRYVILKTGLALVLAVCVYLAISVVLLRLGPSYISHENEQTSHEKQQTRSSIKRGLDTAGKAYSFAPRLFVVGFNRMAMATPYYYDRFTTKGPICGTLLDRIERKPSKCQPSTYIYKQMFGDDGFVGTAPAALNIYGYALGGWTGAFAETVVASILLGLLLSLYGPAQSQPTIMAAFVMGGYAAYFMTQLPVEGSVIYTHGMLWWALLVVALSIPLMVSRLRRIVS